MSTNSYRTTSAISGTALVCGAVAAYILLAAIITGHHLQLGSPKTTTTLAVLVVVPAVLIHGLRRDGWFNPLALPAAYLAVILIAPIAYVQATGVSLGYLTPTIIDQRLTLVLGLLFVGYAVGAAVGMATTRPATESRAEIDYRRLRRIGRGLLVAAFGSELGILILTHGQAYGANQIARGLRAQLAAFTGVAVVAAMTMIVISNIALARRAMFAVDWALFGSLAAAVFTIGGRGPVIPGLVLITWGWLSQRKVPWTRIIVLTIAVAILFAGLVSARKGGSLLPSSGQQTEQALLRSVSSPAYLTATVAKEVPATRSYSEGDTYIEAIYFQLPGALARRIFGPPQTGAYVYRDLTNFNDPNQGFGFSMPAEAYLNFGPWGVPIVGAIVGLLFGWAWRKRLDQPANARQALYLVLVCTFPFAIRSDALGSIKLVLYPMLALWIAFKICRVQARKEASQPATTGQRLGAPRVADERAVVAFLVGRPSPPIGQLSPTLPGRADDRRPVAPRPCLSTATQEESAATPPLATMNPPQTRPASEPSASKQPDIVLTDDTMAGRRTANRAVAFLADESLSSLQNFVMVFAALRYLSISSLGLFTIAYAFVLLVETLLRSLLLTPLLIRFSDADEAAQREAARRASGAALGAGIVCALVVALSSLATHGETRTILLAVSFAIPWVIVQEAWRTIFFAQGRPWRAGLNDGFTLICTLCFLIPVVTHSLQPSAANMLMLWALGAACGADFGMLQTRILPALTEAREWLRENWALGGRLAGAQSAERIASQASFAIIAAVAGSAALGEVSAARTLVSPFTTLVVAVSTFAVPEAARLYRRRNRWFRRFIPGISLALAMVILVFGVIVYSLPDDIGRILAGANWHVAKLEFLPILIWTGANAVRSGPLIGLQVMERARIILRLSVIAGIGMITAVTTAAVFEGAAGAAWAFACFATAMSVTYYVVFLGCARSARAHDRQALTAAPDAPLVSSAHDVPPPS